MSVNDTVWRSVLTRIGMLKGDVNMYLLHSLPSSLPPLSPPLSLSLSLSLSLPQGS